MKIINYLLILFKLVISSSMEGFVSIFLVLVGLGLFLMETNWLGLFIAIAAMAACEKYRKESISKLYSVASILIAIYLVRVLMVIILGTFI